ncbi:hypothetical protein DCAR_0936102 [Daucus carota subsp. sativus]|uniref:Transmembrane protein n=1 Tax=Daucus carota subsp. sativus TaxID=79200 RepID=A0AAF0Y394_DAUCS|nr:PREDICTED: uncharacterized protein LOC108201774 [Daucus carota subsp. sativus]XP_017225556.1 PREDICTED: uncharacterized protein LOC108201774 [Daucus carota subsp. sativus]WOH16546.1 hypothetical protein DCAR_0936102 [Daucus carota subsp. sativus]
MTDNDTNTLNYWLNWRFFLCGTWVLTAMVAAAVLIWKYEGFTLDKIQRRDDGLESAGCLNKDEAWRTCSKAIHPAWLLALRIIAFTVLLALLAINIITGGADIFYFYTLWTFALVTIYFGIGSSFSIYGCFYCCNGVDDDRADFAGVDTERGSYVAPSYEGNADLSNMPINFPSQEEEYDPRSAGFWGYVFQVVFQTSAGAVMLTDSVFWFVIYPFLTPADHKLHFLEVCMHSLNAVFLLADICLNHLRFPFFRIAYFVQFTCIFVVVQWTIHACASMWWPYPFLDLSSPYAPLWYLGIGLVHLPCYGIVLLIIRTKKACLSRFPS